MIKNEWDPKNCSSYLRCKKNSYIILGVDIVSYSGPSGILGSDGKQNTA